MGRLEKALEKIDELINGDEIPEKESIELTLEKLSLETTILDGFVQSIESRTTQKTESPVAYWLRKGKEDNIDAPGVKERHDMPKSCFLKPDEEKYPICPSGSKKPHLAMVIWALKRARMYDDKEVIKAAYNFLKRHPEGKELIPHLTGYWDEIETKSKKKAKASRE